MDRCETISEALDSITSLEELAGFAQALNTRPKDDRVRKWPTDEEKERIAHMKIEFIRNAR